MLLRELKKKKRKIAGFSLIEATVAMTLMIVTTHVMMRENLALIKDKRWAVKAIFSRGLLDFNEIQARSADITAIDPAGSNSANPWKSTAAAAVPQLVNLGTWPGGNTPITCYLTRSSEVSDDGEYREIRLQQSVTFRSGNKYYQMTSTVIR